MKTLPPVDDQVIEIPQNPVDPLDIGELTDEERQYLDELNEKANQQIKEDIQEVMQWFKESVREELDNIQAAANTAEQFIHNAELTQKQLAMVMSSIESKVKHSNEIHSQIKKNADKATETLNQLTNQIHENTQKFKDEDFHQRLKMKTLLNHMQAEHDWMLVMHDKELMQRLNQRLPKKKSDWNESTVLCLSTSITALFLGVYALFFDHPK